MARDITYRDDDVLWRGVARLANEAINNQALSRRAEIAGFTAGSIDKGNPPPALRLKDLLPQLKRISR
jgi:hypothetical protein